MIESPIASTVVQGIGFLAGGVILARGGRVRGITTAADIWVTAAIGVLIGCGFLFLAISATITTIVVLGPLKWLETRLTPRIPASRTADSQTEDSLPNGSPLDEE